MNAVSANLAILKTNICDLGWPRTAVKTYAYSAGQSLTVGFAWEEMTNFRTVIPAGYLSQPGDALLVEGQCTPASNANPKYMKFSCCAADTRADVWACALNLATHGMFFRMIVRRNTAVAGNIAGICWDCVGGGYPTAVSQWYLTGSTMVCDWANATNFKFWFYASAPGDLRLNEVGIWGIRGLVGTGV